MVEIQKNEYKLITELINKKLIYLKLNPKKIVIITQKRKNLIKYSHI